VPPFSEVKFDFNVAAPSVAGQYHFQWRMLQEGVEWLGSSSPDLVVTVGQLVRARQRGYTHLIGGAKRNRKLARALENRVARDYPDRYERCCSLSGLASTEPRHASSLVAIAAATAASS
jgi:hypothetical protein